MESVATQSGFTASSTKQTTRGYIIVSRFTSQLDMQCLLEKLLATQKLAGDQKKKRSNPVKHCCVNQLRGVSKSHNPTLHGRKPARFSLRYEIRRASGFRIRQRCRVGRNLHRDRTLQYCYILVYRRLMCKLCRVGRIPRPACA